MGEIDAGGAAADGAGVVGACVGGVAGVGLLGAGGAASVTLGVCSAPFAVSRTLSIELLRGLENFFGNISALAVSSTLAGGVEGVAAGTLRASNDALRSLTVGLLDIQ